MSGIIQATNLQTDNIKSSGGTSAMTIDSSGRVLFPNRPSFRAYLSSDQSQSGITQIIFNTESFDSGNTYNTSNGRFTPSVVGKYYVNASIGIDGADANGRIRVHLYKNGASYTFSNSGIASTADYGGVAQCSSLIELDADDYVTAHVEYTGSDAVTGQSAKTWFEGFLIG